MVIKNKNILVTGGAGFIASHFVDKIAKNNKVTVLDNFSVGEEENLTKAKVTNNITVVNADIRNLNDVKRIMKGIDIVYHFAAKGVRESIHNPMIVHEVNALGALHLYMAAYENHIQRFIHISSSEVYGSGEYVPMDENHPLRPETVYGASKLAGELYGLAYYRTYHLPVIVIRPFNTYGPRSHFAGPYGEVIPRFVIRVLNNLPPIIFGDGTQTRDFTYVSDTVEGILLASAHDGLIGQTINIAYGQERTIKEVATIVLDTLDRKKLTVQYQDARPGDVSRHFADVKKAKNMLGFKATVPLEEGIKKYITWLSKQSIDIKYALQQVTERNW